MRHLRSLVDPRLHDAISSPRVRQKAGDLVASAHAALERLHALDDGLYERFVATRSTPQAPEEQAASLRRLWAETFAGVEELLEQCRSLAGDKPNEDADTDEIEFGEFDETAVSPPPAEFDLGAGDIGELLEGIDETKPLDDDARWMAVLEKVASIEYGLRSQLGDARGRLDVALGAGDLPVVLGLLDDTQSSVGEGVHALVTAVYDTFVPDADPTSIVPGYQTALGRALLVRRGLAELARELAPRNDRLQSPDTPDPKGELDAIRALMRDFVESPVCRAMRAADRWQIVEITRQLAEEELGPARLTSEGLAKYLESLAAVNQREVLLVHDRRAMDELDEAIVSARQLVELSPRTGREILERAHRAAHELRGRRPKTDALIAALGDVPAEGAPPSEITAMLERLEALLAASRAG